MTAVSLSILPIRALWAIGQKWFVEGIALTGLKGKHSRRSVPKGSGWSHFDRDRDRDNRRALPTSSDPTASMAGRHARGSP